MSEKVTKYDEDIYEDGWRDGYNDALSEKHGFIKPRSSLLIFGIVIFTLLMMFGQIVNTKIVDTARQVLDIEIEKMPSYVEFRSNNGSRILIYWTDNSRLPLRDNIRLGNIDFIRENKGEKL